MQVKIKNAVQIKKYSNYYKITICKNISKGPKSSIHTKKGEAGNERKLSNSISRSKKQVLEKSLCNDWNWFMTLTLDPLKYQRDDLSQFIKDLGQFIRDYRKKYTDYPFRYLLIPELHADGKNWHMHGLFTELPFEDLEIHPVKDLSEKGYLNWIPYQRKFGFNSIGAIRDETKTAMYITKYISKDLEKSVTEFNSKLYYCSRGLKTAELVDQGRLIKHIDFQMAFEGDFSKSQFVNDYEFFKEYYKQDNF